MRALIAAALVVATFGWAVAKLPPPAPLDEKAKAAAEEKKAKDAAGAEAAAVLRKRLSRRLPLPSRPAHGIAAKSPRHGHLFDACRRTLGGCARSVE